MFQEKNHQTSPQEAWLYPVYPSTQLLSLMGHKQLLDSIQQSIMSECKSPNDSSKESAMIEQYYDVCYDDLFHRYTQFVQCLSEPRLHWEEFMVNRSFARVASTLKILGHHIPQVAKAHPRLGGVEKVLYAVVSATLLYEVGRVCENRVVHLCNHQGDFIDVWDPLTGPIESSSSFKIRFEQNWQPDLLGPLTICYARSIMPKIGMLWLADSPELFNWWFKLLQDPEAGYSEFGMHFSISRCQELMKEIALEALPVDRRLSHNHMAGEHFWQWLNEALENGRIRYNQADAYAHMTKDGLLLDYERAIEEFMSVQGRFADKGAIARQLRNMGVTGHSGSDFRVVQYMLSYPGGQTQSSSLFRQESSAQQFSGIIIHSASLQHGAHMPASEHVSPAATGSWVSEFFQRFINLINASGFDHTRQP